MPDSTNLALVAAGIIGCVTAVIHGVIVRKILVAPATRLMSESGTPRSIIGLVGPLIQFSTFAWLLAGIALIIVGAGGAPDARWSVGLMAAALFLYGAVGNAWATRGRHPGWVMMALACGLIAYALGG